MNYTLEELKKAWDFYNNRAKEIIENAFNITSKFIDSDMLQRYREYKDKNNFKENYPFNIFELISDTYYRENFHSNIISQLLKNEIILKNFLKFIGVDETAYINDGYDIIPEYSIKHEIKNGRIDILIKSNDKENKEKSHCIIIENKLYNAGDEERQLYRYYDACIKDFKVDKIVYLSPNSLKQPEEQSIKDIPKGLIKTIIGYDGENKDFYTMVLEKSLKEMNNNEPKEWLLLLEHYLKILRLTGETKMDALTEKFYEKIKKEPQEYEKIKLIADMYNNLKINRINYLAEKFGGAVIYEEGNHEFYREFESKKIGLKHYNMGIFMVNDFSYLYIRSDEKFKNSEKYKQDNKDIKNWLKKHELDYFSDLHNEFPPNWDWDFLTKKFKFPDEEKELCDFTEKLIKCLEEDVESIYSGK